MGENRIPQAGDFYRHFKNKLYQIVTIASHSETGEQLVIYQALYGTYGIYARPLDMFISEVDHNKYPNVTQKYRFQYITKKELAQETNQSTNEINQKVKEEKSNMDSITSNRTNEDSTIAGTMNKSRIKIKDLNDFLDANSAHEKLEIFHQMRNDMTDFMLDSIAVCLDYVPSGDSLEERYFSICKYLEMKITYESKR